MHFTSDFLNTFKSYLHEKYDFCLIFKLIFIQKIVQYWIFKVKDSANYSFYISDGVIKHIKMHLKLSTVVLQFLWVTAYIVQLRFFTMIPEVLYVVKNMFFSGGQPNTGQVELSFQALVALILSTPNV